MLNFLISLSNALQNLAKGIKNNFENLGLIGKILSSPIVAIILILVLCLRYFSKIFIVFTEEINFYLDKWVTETKLLTILLQELISVKIDPIITFLWAKIFDDKTKYINDGELRNKFGLEITKRMISQLYLFCTILIISISFFPFFYFLIIKINEPLLFEEYFLGLLVLAPIIHRIIRFKIQNKPYSWEPEINLISNDSAPKNNFSKYILLAILFAILILIFRPFIQLYFLEPNSLIFSFIIVFLLIILGFIIKWLAKLIQKTNSSFWGITKSFDLNFLINLFQIDKGKIFDELFKLDFHSFRNYLPEFEPETKIEANLFVKNKGRKTEKKIYISKDVNTLLKYGFYSHREFENYLNDISHLGFGFIGSYKTHSVGNQYYNYKIYRKDNETIIFVDREGMNQHFNLFILNNNVADKIFINNFQDQIKKSNFEFKVGGNFDEDWK